MALFVVASCTSWPDVQGPTDMQAPTGWPTLRPLDEFKGASVPEQSEEDAGQTLAERADALRRRAAVLRRPVSDQDDFDDLRARIIR